MTTALLRQLALAASLAAAAPAWSAPVISQAGNLLANGNFEVMGSAASVTSGYGVGAASALGSWNQYANSSPGTTTTWASAPQIEGVHLARIQGGVNNGLYQYPGTLSSGYYTISGWIYALGGQGKLGMAWNGGSNVQFVGSTLVGQWEYLELTVSFASSSIGGALVYAGQASSDFYAEGLWLDHGSSSASPFRPSAGFNPAAPVPEPATLTLAVLALGAVVLAQRRRRGR